MREEPLSAVSVGVSAGYWFHADNKKEAASHDAAPNTYKN